MGAMRRGGLALGSAPVWALVPALAGAEPLDVSDPTPRTIQIEFEISVNPATAGQTWSAPFEATYSATGNTGTVVVSASEYASAIATHDLDYFGVLMSWSLVPGSATAFRLDIDLSTLEATAQTASYEVLLTGLPVPDQFGTVTRELSTTATAGFAFLPQFPGFPFFCTPCIPVPGGPYNPATGTLNAVGSDVLDAPDVDLQSFSRAGDLRLSELPAPAVPAVSGYGLLGLAALLMFGRRPGR
jgi:hypothetical protein